VDRRLVSWLLLTTGLFLLWVNTRQFFAPDPQERVAVEDVAGIDLDRPAEDAELDSDALPTSTDDPADATSGNEESISNDELADAQEAEVTSDADLLEGNTVDGSEPIEPTPAEDSLAASSTDDNPTDTTDATGAESAPPEPAASFPAGLHSLGSHSPASGYTLSVTLNNQGGSLERVEIVARQKNGRYRYRSLVEEGYLGHLSLSERSGGLAVRVVPDASPAATAVCKTNTVADGILVGDVITAVNGQTTSTWSEYYALMKQTREDDVVELTVQRSGQPKPLVFDAVLTEAPLDVIRQASTLSEPEEIAGNIARLSCLATIGEIDGRRLTVDDRVLAGLERTLNGNWEATKIDLPSGQGIEFRLPIQSMLKKIGIEANLVLVKRYVLEPADPESFADNSAVLPFDLKYSITVENNGDTPHTIGVRQEGFNGLTLEGWWYSQKISQSFTGAGTRDIVYDTDQQQHTLLTRREIYTAVYDTPGQNSDNFFNAQTGSGPDRLNYIGVDTPFFAAVFTEDQSDPGAMGNISSAAYVAIANVQKIVKSQAQAMNVGFWFDTTAKEIAAGQKESFEYDLFVGPKAPEVLAAYNIDSVLEYGWFGIVARPLSSLLHFFYWIVGNYGVAIILLTVLVRGCMFPLGRKAAVNAQRMQAIAPEIKAASEKYKDDWEQKTKATQEIYKKYKFNPMAGCLPMFIQLPIFVGLYRALSVDIELRQQSLIPGLEWCSNLAGPDMFYNWSSFMPEFFAGRGTGWLGPYFNILPLVTVALFIFQQKVLMPKPTDEQQALTQKMMMYMTLFMAVLFFKVPAGLCIYFISSSLWSIFERTLVKRMTPPLEINDLAVATPAPASGGSSSNGKGRIASKSQSKPVKRSKASERPEKLSDVLPWLKRKAEEQQASATPSDANTNAAKAKRRKPPKRSKR
jgi:YidC/Oxa1 family membrane protein insertase